MIDSWPYYVAVRRTDQPAGEWYDLSTASASPTEARRLADDYDRAWPRVAEAMPVVRIAKVAIIETDDIMVVRAALARAEEEA